MEVPCYTDGKIQEFSDQIHRLKQEYRAYLRKLRALEPDISAASWADRPYANRKRQAGRTTAGVVTFPYIYNIAVIKLIQSLLSCFFTVYNLVF